MVKTIYISASISVYVLPNENYDNAIDDQVLSEILGLTEA